MSLNRVLHVMLCWPGCQITSLISHDLIMLTCHENDVSFDEQCCLKLSIQIASEERTITKNPVHRLSNQYMPVSDRLLRVARRPFWNLCVECCPIPAEMGRSSPGKRQREPGTWNGWERGTCSLQACSHGSCPVAPSGGLCLVTRKQ